VTRKPLGTFHVGYGNRFASFFKACVCLLENSSCQHVAQYRDTTCVSKSVVPSRAQSLHRGDAREVLRCRVGCVQVMHATNSDDKK
jgi:hypothetical protein